MTYYDLDLYNKCIQTVEENNLVCQKMERNTAKTESRSVQTSCQGVPVLALGMPCRYPYSISAMIAKEDLEHTRKLIFSLLKTIEEK